MRRRLTLALGILCVLMVGGEPATDAAKRTSTPVTSTILDWDPAHNTLYSLRSDALAEGVYRNGVDSVLSQLQSSEEWELSTLASPTRAMYINFQNPVNPGGANPPFSDNWVKGRFVTKCYLLYNTSNDGPGYPAVGNMTGLNSTRDCPLLFTFDLNGALYQVWMNSVQYAGTDNARVTCAGVVDPAQAATSKCNRWSVGPAGTNGGPDPVTGQVRNVARLVKLVTAKGKTTQQHLGDYYMTFGVGISVP